MIRFLTAGESHGKALTTIVEGFPSNLEITEEYINNHLRRRQLGYGRGGRMKIETDRAEILSGIRYRKTLGSPISLLIENKDWKNWTDSMSYDKPKSKVEKISIPRPGHADLTGVTKYDFEDIRNSIERSSARETAARVAAGSVARKFLEEFDINIGSYVQNIGNVFSKDEFLDKLLEHKIRKDFNAGTLSESADKSSVRVLDPEHEKKIIRKIQKAKKNGDTLGGTFVVVATGVPVGLGSFVHFDTKLNVELSSAVMSINAVKGVEIGSGFELGNHYGSEVHDTIVFNNGNYSRSTNYSGGIEGGISTGLPIIIRGVMKPIATLMSPIQTVDLTSNKKVMARRERSDFVAVPACAVIAESMVAWGLAKFFLHKFGGDSMREIKLNYNNWIKNFQKNLQKNFH